MTTMDRIRNKQIEVENDIVRLKEEIAHRQELLERAYVRMDLLDEMEIELEEYEEENETSGWYPADEEANEG